MKQTNSTTTDCKRMSRAELAERLSALQAKSKKDGTESIRGTELRDVLHELEVSQIELEVQNRELIESRRALGESHDRYLNLYDFAPVGYVTLDKMGFISEINLTAADLLGVERQRLLKHSLAVRIFKNDLQKFREHLLSCRDTERKVSTTIHLLREDQTQIPVQLLSTCVQKRETGEMLFPTAITDLTEQKRAEQVRQELADRVEAARKELHDFFMQAPSPMAVLTGPDHVFTLANAPYVEFAGKEVVGKTVKDVFSASDHRTFVDVLDRVYKTGKPYVGREIYSSKCLSNGDKKNAYLNVSYTAFRCSQGKIKGVLVFEQDVTDQVLARKRLEAEKENELRNQESLRIEKAEAERASYSKSAFLANMSHEIRTPLGAILGFTELIRDSVSREERAEFAKIVIRNGKALTRLIDDILDLSKVEAGRLELERIDFSVKTLAEEIIRLFQESARQKDVGLRFRIATGTPEYVNSDPTRIRQILVNLIGNAVKFTSHGGIELLVTLRLNGSGHEQLEFQVKDSGIGLSEEQASRLFEPFTQADNSTTRRFGGSGLGLVLSRRLARVLGGDVSIRDFAPGEGCTFVATVEANPVKMNEGNVFQNLDSIDAHITENLHRAKVLLVEDSADNQILIKRLLSQIGISVDVANNGAEGVEMAESNDYDVVLMDMQMPILDGYAATEQLRHDGYSKPIVALTAHAMVEDRNRILALGCNAHLTKPLDSKLLIETILRHLLLH